MSQSSSDRASSVPSEPDHWVNENTCLEGELSPKDARKNVKDTSRRVDRAGRHIIPRAISGFSFQKYGRPFRLTPGMTDKDWLGVQLVGYVTGLSWLEMRPIVATGYWDLNGSVVGRELMRVSPHHIYTDVSPYFRPGSRTIWADTYNFGYALLQPNPFYQQEWNKFIDGWMPNGRPVPQFRDFKSTDPDPVWWPIDQPELLKTVRKLIAEAEGGDEDEEEEEGDGAESEEEGPGHASKGKGKEAAKDRVETRSRSGPAEGGSSL
ncbi:hypothetical protein FRC10_001802, partial [Ceratobasidium sp. 414]